MKTKEVVLSEDSFILYRNGEVEIVDADGDSVILGALEVQKLREFLSGDEVSNGPESLFAAQYKALAAECERLISVCNAHKIDREVITAVSDLCVMLIKQDEARKELLKEQK